MNQTTKDAVPKDERALFEQALRDMKFAVLPVWKYGSPHQNYALEVMWKAWMARAATTSEGGQEPVAWVRYRSDGGFEGPIMDSDSRMCDTRRGFWTPLYDAPVATTSEMEQAPSNDPTPLDDETVFVIQSFVDRPGETYRGFITRRLGIGFGRALRRAIEESRAAPVAPTPETADPIDVAVALEQQRALQIVASVRKQGFARSGNDIPTQAESIFDLACEEIEHRLKTEAWELNGVSVPIAAAAQSEAEKS